MDRDTLSNVFSFLSYRDIRKVRKVSKLFNEVSKNIMSYSNVEINNNTPKHAIQLAKRVVWNKRKIRDDDILPNCEELVIKKRKLLDKFPVAPKLKKLELGSTFPISVIKIPENIESLILHESLNYWSNGFNYLGIENLHQLKELKIEDKIDQDILNHIQNVHKDNLLSLRLRGIYYCWYLLSNLINFPEFTNLETLEVSSVCGWLNPFCINFDLRKCKRMYFGVDERNYRYSPMLDISFSSNTINLEELALHHLHIINLLETIRNNRSLKQVYLKKCSWEEGVEDELKRRGIGYEIKK